MIKVLPACTLNPLAVRVGLNLDKDKCFSVKSDEVNFASPDVYITGNDAEALSTQVARSDPFAAGADANPVVGQPPFTAKPTNHNNHLRGTEFIPECSPPPTAHRGASVEVYSNPVVVATDEVRNVRRQEEGPSRKPPKITTASACRKRDAL